MIRWRSVVCATLSELLCEKILKAISPPSSTINPRPKPANTLIPKLGSFFKRCKEIALSALEFRPAPRKVPG